MWKEIKMEGIEKLSQYFEENQEYCYRVAYHLSLIHI